MGLRGDKSDAPAPEPADEELLDAPPEEQPEAPDPEAPESGEEPPETPEDPDAPEAEEAGEEPAEEAPEPADEDLGPNTVLKPLMHAGRVIERGEPVPSDLSEDALAILRGSGHIS